MTSRKRSPSRDSQRPPVQGRFSEEVRRRRRRLRRLNHGRTNTLPQPEVLESRQLLASDSSNSAFLSVGAMRAELARANKLDNIKNVTIVSHGWSLTGTGESLYPLASEIQQLTKDRDPATAAWLLDYDQSPDGKDGFDWASTGSGHSVRESATPTSVVLLWDWGAQTRNNSAGWTEAAGDALFSTLVGLGLVDPAKGAANSRTFHFIAHSYGCAMTSEAVERFGEYGVKIDQVTYLDPHDFDPDVGVAAFGLANEEYQRQWTLGQPQLPQIAGESSGVATHSYGAANWKHVAFTDVYYQTGSIGDIIPEGRPIPGAYNTFIPSTNRWLAGFIQQDHSDVWERWYVSSIRPNVSHEGKPVTDNVTGKGYAYSALAAANFNGATARVAARPTGSDRYNFASPSQDHEWTSQAIVKAGTERYAAFAGVADVDRFSILGGDFSNPAVEVVKPGKLFEAPGWAPHGGTLPTGYGNGAFTLTHSPGLGLRHNRLYVPAEATLVSFDATVRGTDSGQVLRVLLNNTQIGEPIPLSTMSRLANTRLAVEVPVAHRNAARTLAFELSSPTTGASCAVTIDNVLFTTVATEAGDLAALDMDGLFGGSGRTAITNAWAYNFNELSEEEAEEAFENGRALPTGRVALRIRSIDDAAGTFELVYPLADGTQALVGYVLRQTRRPPITRPRRHSSYGPAPLARSSESETMPLFHAPAVDSHPGCSWSSQGCHLQRPSQWRSR